MNMGESFSNIDINKLHERGMGNETINYEV